MTTERHDQTRGESPPRIAKGDSAPLSRNEAGSLCMKAARGAGMSWGLAEEAGYAAAWLVQYGFDGPLYLNTHLQAAQGRQWPDLCPAVTPGQWHAPAGRALCPIALGATLCDYAALADGVQIGAPIRIGAVDHPVLVIPFLADIAAANAMLFDISWTGGAAHLDGSHSALAQAVSALDGLQQPITLTARSGTPHITAIGAVPDISAATIAALTALAMRTTVPSSEASRAGAGSATSDND